MISRIKSTLFSFYEKVLPFFDTKKQKLSDFLNLPQVKLVRNNLILGSLLLIITKLIVGEYLDLKLRLGLLLLFTGISSVYNFRMKIKPLSGKLLYYSLGLEVLHFFKDDLNKEDYEFIDSGQNPTVLKKIIFEIKWFYHYLFFHFFILITTIRLFFDNHIIIYFFVYYSILFLVIYIEKGIIISFFGLFMIATRLLVYLSENNYSEVCSAWRSSGYNENLSEKKLKMTKKNIMIFTFWNVRDIENFPDFLDDREKNYSLGVIFIARSNTIYKFTRRKIVTTKNLPFDFKNK